MLSRVNLVLAAAPADAVYGLVAVKFIELLTIIDYPYQMQWACDGK